MSVQSELKTPLGTYLIEGSYTNCTAYIKTQDGERQVQELGDGCRLTFSRALWHYDTVCIAQQDKIAEWNKLGRTTTTT